MNESTYDKSKKNCLLCFGNKKVNFFDTAIKIAESFSSQGYYFEKTAFIAFNNSFEIVAALKDGLENHENLVIICPQSMEKTLKDFVTASRGGEFDGLGVLKCAQNFVFILLSDCVNRLTVSEICGYLNEKYQTEYERAFIRTVGAPPELLDEAIREGKSICPELEFNVKANFGDCRTEIVYNSSVSKSVFDRAYRAVVKRLQDYIYALEDISLAERLYHLLKLRRMKIAVAESFTGGGISAELVKISGVSEVYFEGLNTYSNQSKIRRLGVDEFVLNTYGAVSRETAAQMAQGLIASGNCDVSVATTGIAGPKSDNSKKPVGLAYIAVGSREGADVYEFNFSGSREEITKTAINYALYAVFKKIK